MVYGTSGNFNDGIIVDSIIKRLLVPYKLSESLDQIHFVMDHAPCHSTSLVRNSCISNNIEITYIPKRLTNMLQPADVAWMRPLKIAFHRLWNDWMVNTPKSHTKFGNVKSPGYALAINWIAQIWQNMDSNLLASSFDQSGLTTNNKDHYHRQLKHFIETNELIDDVADDDGTSDLRGFYEEDERRGVEDDGLVDDDDSEESEDEDED